MSETAGPAGATETGQAAATVVVDTVSKHYTIGNRVTALDAVSLSLDEGSYTAIMGPSGSGKSTLLNLIGGLDTPSSGTVTVDGQQVSTADEDERAAIRGTAIGFVFQTFNLMPRLTAIENVALPLVFDGWAEADEPTGNVDTDTGGEILDIFDELHAAGNTLLVVTHERHVAERADRIIHVEDGNVRDTESLTGGE